MNLFEAGTCSAVGIKKVSVSMLGILKWIPYRKHNMMTRKERFIKKQNFMLNGLKNSKVHYENQKENNTVKYLKPESNLQPVLAVALLVITRAVLLLIEKEVHSTPLNNIAFML